MAAEHVEEPLAAVAPVPTVLIVEDEILIRTLLCDTLRHAGYAVIEAANAEEAVSVLHASLDPDILITDVRMPGTIDGFELAAYVKRTRPALKVIITSGHAGAQQANGLADAFLPKPYQLGAIMGRIRALIEPQ